MNQLPGLANVEILVSRTDVPRWQAQVIERIASIEGVRSRVVVANGMSSAPSRSANWLRSRIEVLERVGVSMSRQESEHATGPQDLCLDLSVCEAAPGTSSIVGDCPRLRFVSPDGCICSECMPFATAIWRGIPGVRLMLIMTPPGGGTAQVLRHGEWRARPERYPLFLNRTLGDVTDWPASAIRRIAEGRSPAIGMPPSPEWHRLPVSDPRVGGTKLLLGLVRGVIQKAARDLLRHEQWTIGIVEAPIRSFLDPGFRAQFRWRRERSRRSYLADPFGWIDGHRTLVLAEEFDHIKNRGRIVQLHYDRRAGWSEPRTFIDLPHHLSFPYPYEWQGRRYVVPECFQSASIRSFAITDQGGLRESQLLISNFPGVDATLFEWQSRWWILATSKDVGPDSHLFAWYAPAPTGPWQPHADNPVKIDLRSSRPGGTPFIVDDVLYRPAQDCRRTYGARIVINRILELTPESFREQTVGCVEPDLGSPWCDGLHTLSAAGPAHTLVDAKREIFSPYAAVANLSRAVRKAVRALVGAQR